ncbi:MAG TPA: exodeoxyribonuclease VII small subunit, partial [Aminobacteriaceae bacterium]|nr:exodeoxyribonuclease VII small subunit [Aminobacteriaceae bacterium]
MSFSGKMDELEGIVARIEKEALPLEDALALFEKGI